MTISSLARLQGGNDSVLVLAQVLAVQCHELGLQWPRRMSSPLFVSSALTIPADELRWTAVRSSGPGGQNVNKVSSKIELRFDFEHSAVLLDDTRARLRVIAQGRLDSAGRFSW